MGARAAVVVTGTEVLTGRVTDRNGPWLAEQLRVAGVDIAQVIVVGDRPTDLREALRFLLDSALDLIITTGGLGPTADDVTAEVVADVQGRPRQLDPALEQRIAAIVARLSAGRGGRSDPAATATATRKQALVPRGATVLEPVGTAPGLVVPPSAGQRGAPIVVLPGPPRELQGMWPAVIEDVTVRAALGGATELRQETVRLWGTPESELAALLRGIDSRLAGLEITTCLRDGELEIVTRFAPPAHGAYLELVAALQEHYPAALYSPHGLTVDAIIAQALTERRLTIATAESCTAGLLAGRLTAGSGSSAFMLGGLVVYSNQAKHDLADVAVSTLNAVGAVSAEVALALAEGARDRLQADIGVGITGIAGPNGASPGKPVGLVHLCVVGPNVTLPRQINVPGSRADVRQRTVVVALHMIRELLA